MPAPLIIAAHGSRDPRFAEVVDRIADHTRALLPGVDVRIGYLDHGPPHLSEACEPDAVVVPLLLSGGFHVHVDLPEQAAGLIITPPVGPDPLIADALADRLSEAGYDGQSPVTLAAAGSADARSLADVAKAAGQLAARLGVEVQPAFVAAGEPRLAHVSPRVVASYLLSPGVFAQAVIDSGAQLCSAPIGAHPLLAEIVRGRYRAAG